MSFGEVLELILKELHIQMVGAPSFCEIARSKGVCWKPNRFSDESAAKPGTLAAPARSMKHALTTSTTGGNEKDEKRRPNKRQKD